MVQLVLQSAKNAHMPAGRDPVPENVVFAILFVIHTLGTIQVQAKKTILVDSRRS